MLLPAAMQQQVCLGFVESGLFRKFGVVEPFGRPRKTTPEKRLHKLLFANKVPLEKSLSMPDIQTKAKKRERLMV